MDEQYKQYAGFDYSKKLIEQLAEIKLYNSKIFIDFFSDPRALLLGAIEDIAYSKNKKLELELHNTRNTKIVSSKHKFKDSFVNWSTWRQFNSLEKNQIHRNYFFRNKVYSNLDINFSSIDPLIEVRKILAFMQFDLTKIIFDTESRKNKYPSPICFFVQIPHDIRILYKKESPYFDLQGCFHEFGHGIHARCQLHTNVVSFK